VVKTPAEIFDPPRRESGEELRLGQIVLVRREVPAKLKSGACFSQAPLKI